MGNDKNKNKLSELKGGNGEEIVRARIPRDNQAIGIVEKRLGGSRMHVKIPNGKTVLARVPGKVKKYLWIREGDVVLVEYWELDKEKADLIYKYKPAEINQLIKKGYLEDLENIEEF